MMNVFDEYLERANAIIGVRTKEEEMYDNEVVKWLRKYGKIRKALNKANKKYPEEALQFNEENIGDLQDRYEYMVTHYDMVKKLNHLTNQ